MIAYPEDFNKSWSSWIAYQEVFNKTWRKKIANQEILINPGTAGLPTKRYLINPEIRRSVYHTIDRTIYHRNWKRYLPKLVEGFYTTANMNYLPSISRQDLP